MHLNKQFSEFCAMKGLRICAALLLPCMLYVACTPSTDLAITELELRDSARARDYFIQVYEPENAERIIYVLDGNERMQDVLTVLEKQEKEAVVVAVGYKGRTQRTSDYSPSPWNVEGAGEAQAFFDFLSQSIMPNIHSDFGLSGKGLKTALIGHSLGGLAATYAALQYNAFFDEYLMISPALNWDSQYIFDLEEEARGNNQNDPSLLYFVSGSYESVGMTTAMQAFADRMREHHPQAVVRSEVLQSEGHQSIYQPAVRLFLKDIN